MIDIASLVSEIRATPDCEVYPASGVPTVLEPHVIPPDIHSFYALCGGGMLYKRSSYSIRIVPPSEFVVANSVVFVGLSEAQLSTTKDEISWSWYLMATGESGEYFTIDLDSTRLERCYYGFWDSYAMQGHSPIIAYSFTEFVSRLLENKGESWYWESPGFGLLRDAYD